ncbi:MAG: helix-turn-helix transcriptional regulator [Flavobacteriaceae bacterium]|nr:helix-turn-helix transcriptional regulator [Flavobacteriaceae bacterium]
MIFQGKDKEYFRLKTVGPENKEVLAETKERSLTILWFESGVNELIVDGQEHIFKRTEMVFFTEFHRVKPIRVGKIRYLRFNQDFYCVQDNDTEVACKGMLFFGASELPVITIPEELLETLETIWTLFNIEIQSADHLQMQMLQMMLRRYLILCTRMYKKQANYPKGSIDSNIVREFNFLVENNFKTKHSVAEYAKLMNKSPKTISNIFSKISTKTPQQFIQHRRLLEARRLLQYSCKQVQEVAYEIGYDDIQSFSRFFKKHTGISPSKFKETQA